MKAKLSNLRISPRKVRLVANLVKGKTVSDSELLLSYLPKRSSEPVLKLLKSAFANASVNGGSSPEEMVIKTIKVDEGLTMKRYMPRAFGRPSAIKKRSSHVFVELALKPEKKEKVKKKSKDEVKAEAKKEAKAVTKKIEKIEKEEAKEENN